MIPLSTTPLPVPTFATLPEALAHWQDRDQAPLKAAVVPPCDRLGDEIYDAMLAVLFKHVARLQTVMERIDHLETAVRVHGAIIAQLRTVGDEHRRQADENVARIEAMLNVLRRWIENIHDAAAQAAIEGRAA